MPILTLPTAGGNLAQWSHSGKDLFYLAPDGKVMRVPIKAIARQELSEMSIGTPEPLFTAPIDPSGFSTRSPLVVANDDQRFLMPIAIDKPTPSKLVVVVNWRPQP